MNIKKLILLAGLSAIGSAFADGRIEISSIPITLSEPGAYVVTENLLGTAGNNGITIAADHVFLDLNGFVLDGVSTNSLDGIRVNGARRNLVIQNGIIKNWGDDGLNATNAVSGRFEGLIVSRNSNAGMEVGFNCVVEACIAYQNGTILFPASPGVANPLGDGFRVENGSTMSMLLSIENSHHAIRGHSGSAMRSSIMINNGHDGFHGSHATVVENSIAAQNSEGIEVDSGSRVLTSVAHLNAEDGVRNKSNDTNIVNDISGGGVFSGNVTHSNQDNNIDVRGPGTIVKGNLSYLSGDHGLRAVAASYIRDNVVLATQNNSDNLRVDDGNGSRVQGNHSIESNNTDEGIQVADSSDGNFVVQNSASGNDGIKLGSGDNHGEDSGPDVNPFGGFVEDAWINFEWETVLP